MNRPATCRGCGATVDLDWGADRGPRHGGITNFYGGTTVYCYATEAWERADTIDPTQPLFRLDEYVRAEIHARARLREALAFSAIFSSLRPRLRWAARRPRALKLLKRLRLWTPPTLNVYQNVSDHELGIASGVVPPEGLAFVTQIHRAPDRMVWDQGTLRFRDADE